MTLDAASSRRSSRRLTYIPPAPAEANPSVGQADRTPRSCRTDLHTYFGICSSSGATKAVKILPSSPACYALQGRSASSADGRSDSYLLLQGSRLLLYLSGRLDYRIVCQSRSSLQYHCLDFRQSRPSRRAGLRCLGIASGPTQQLFFLCNGPEDPVALL